MNYYALISFAGAATSIFLGFFVFARDSRNRVNTIFMLFCVSVAYWCITEFGYRQAQSYIDASIWMKLSALCPLTISLFLDFAIVFTGMKVKLANPWRYLLVYGPAILFILVDLPTNWVTGRPIHVFWGWTYNTTPRSFWFNLYNIWSSGILVALVFMCFRFYTRSTGRRERKQASLVTSGFLVTALLSIVTENFLPYLNIRVPELTTLGFSIANILIGYAMWRHELFTISPVTAAERIVATMSDALFLVDGSGVVKTVNRSAAGLLGRSEYELQGKPLIALFADESVGKSIFDKREEMSHDIEVTMKSSDGREVPVSLSVSAMRDADGTLQGMVVIGRDITNRKLAQEAIRRSRDELEVRVRERTAELAETGERLAEEKERLSVTLRSIGDGVIATDIAGNVLLMNHMAEILTGWPHEKAIGKPVTEVLRIVDVADGNPVDDIVQRVIQTGSVLDLPYGSKLVGADGIDRTIADSASPIRDTSGAIIGAVVVFRDITERQRLEADLFKAKKLESVGVLAGGIAHDFNNILTAITTNLYMAKMEIPAAKESHRLIDEAERAAMRASRLTKQLLTFAKGGEPVKEAASLKTLIEESIGFLLSGSNVDYQLDLDENLLTVEIDKGQIDQVFANLTMNAEQAMPSGGTISITGRNVAIGVDGVVGEDPDPSLSQLRPGFYVKISVRDEGVGMPPHVLERIYDPYFTTKERGTGLGLTIAYSIVKKHEGCIAVKSKEGAGTVFSIYLPATRETAQAQPAAAPENLKGAEKSISRSRILLMDDEEMVRNATGYVLRQLGYEVDCAENGEQAVEMFREASESDRPFTLAILDITVPGGMGGKECIRHLARIDPSLKAIVSSGYSTDPLMANFKKSGFLDVLPKPYRVEELTEIVKRVLDS